MTRRALLALLAIVPSWAKRRATSPPTAPWVGIDEGIPVVHASSTVCFSAGAENRLPMSVVITGRSMDFGAPIQVYWADGAVENIRVGSPRFNQILACLDGPAWHA